jgi:hypothetical protein
MELKRMSPTGVLPLALAAAVCAVAAMSCNEGSGPDQSPTTGTVSSTTGSTGAEASTGDASGTSPDGTDTAGTDTAGTTPDLGICASYIECVMDVAPEIITNVIATYGEEGACWSLPGVAEEDCWTECTALMETLREAFPDSAACWECQSDEDCGDAESCFPVDHSCQPWECQSHEDCPSRTPFCNSVWHECYDWECETDADCPAHAPTCNTSDHTCFAGGAIHCGDSFWCFQGSIEDTAKMCRSMYEAGPCSSDGAIGFCTMTDYGWEVTYYDISEIEFAMAHCAQVGGTWTPA